MRFSHRAALLSVWMPIAVAISACQPTPSEPAATPAAAPAETPVERGKVLVTVGGCHDCHTSKKANGLDESLLLAGHPQAIKVTSPPPKMPAGSLWTIHTTDTLTVWSGAWGMTYAANITPDPETGLKSSAWSEDAFLKAMKTGKHIGTGRDILPPMPWQMYAQLSDNDLKAIWAYLMTVTPIKNEVPDPVPPAK